MEREKKKETEKNSKLYHVLKIPTFCSFCESSFFFILQDCSRNGSCCGNLKISGIINLSVFTPNSRNSTRRATERAKREKERDPRERESRESPKEGENIDLSDIIGLLCLS